MSTRHLTIAARLTLGFGLIGAIITLLGVFALNKMAEINRKAMEIDEKWLPSLVELSDLSTSIMRVRALTLRMALLKDEQVIRETLALLEELDKRIAGLEGAYEKLLMLDSERQAYQRYQDAHTLYRHIQRQVVEHVSQGRHEDAITLINGPVNGYASDLSRALEELMSINRQAAREETEQARQVYEKSVVTVLLTLLGAVALMVGLATVLTRGIVGPLRQALRTAELIADGDLTQPVQSTGKDEPARLLDALRHMQNTLRETVRHMADSSGRLSGAAGELSTLTADATHSLHRQSGELEQAATAVNEMTCAVEEVARNAAGTSQASDEADRTARQGHDQVEQTVASITRLAADIATTADEVERLAGRVQDIGQVLDVIRSIAEQTNLLALNAAIEAARAGEAGRGFAVVADEVRALAHRTQQSTGQIEQMIEGIREDSRQAVHAMQQSDRHAHDTLGVAQAAGEALDRIAGAIAQINERNLVIASAAEEQVQVAREVDRNLTTIRDLSLQTAAGADQTSAASQDLARLAGELNALVGRFRV